MKNVRLFSFIILWLGIYTSIYSQNNYVFEAQKINVENGLPHRSVYDITQDSDGYIWISVPGNISRYDGSNFKTYTSSFLKTGDNLANLIGSDKSNNIWYCERSNLDKPILSGVIDTKKDSIYRFEDFSKGLFSSQDVVHISQSKKEASSIFITTRAGVIYKYSDHFEEIYRFNHSLNNYAICEEDESNGYWILNENHILKIKNQKLLATYSNPNLNGYFYRVVTQKPNLILEVRNALDEKTYWELKNDILSPYTFPNKIKNLKQLFQKTSDYICYSSNDTIYVSNNSGKKIFQFNNIDNSGADFKYQTTLVDRQDILWIASGNGLYKVIPKKNPFKLLQENQSIRGIFKDDDQLYVGSYTENVIINLKTNKKTPFIRVPNVATTSFIKDKKSHIWAGTSTQLLFEFIPKTNLWNYYRLSDRVALHAPLINSKTGKIWIGTANGLAFLNTNTNQIEFIKLPISDTNTEIRHLYQNEKGIWDISNKGIFLMDAETETIIKHITLENGLPNANLNHMYEDTDGTFWLASKEAGLIHWNLETNEFKQYTMQNGLSNNTIYAVYPDNYNNLWLTSNYGLMRFNKETKNVQVYLPKNGIAHEEFNTFAHFQDKDGTLYFGGLNGITVFHPKNLIEDTNTEIPLRLTQLEVLNENNSDFIDITKSFNTTNEIVLKPTDRVLEIEVSLLDFENPSDLQYTYQIEGFQDQWLYTKSNKITFNNLPYGSYTINIKGKGLASSSSSNTLQIPVIVKKPFYLTWQFIALTIALIGLLLFIYVKWRFRKVVKDRNQLEEEVKLRTQQIESDKQIITAQAEALKDLDEAKTRFFSNITHEFRTPLTLIKGPLEQVIENPPPATVLKKRMQGVLKNTNHILGLINQLLDLSKLESGGMKLEVVYNDIIAHTNDVVTRFQQLAKKKEQHLTFITLEKSWKTYFDQEKWDKLLYNLISNAIKFTPKNGNIQVKLNAIIIDNENTIVLEVKDSGIGMDEKQQQSVFNRFYQADNSLTRSHEGSGIGLALVKELITLQGGTIRLESERDKGSTFTILLPILKNHTLSSKQPENIPFESYLNFETGEDEISKNQNRSNDKEKLELLIVEDNEDMRNYIKQCLNSTLYNITEASNGKEGLEKAFSVIPDIIISDVMMPKMNGFELTKTIRNTLSTSHIPLILLTAKSTLESKLEGLARGADAYLTKPFSPKELELRVEKLIELRTLIQKRYEGNIVEPSKTYQQEDGFIIQLKEYIIEHLDETELNGDQIGKHFSISRVQLYRKLKALTNLSVSEYIKNIRLEIALQLVTEGQLNISEIAYKTGFSSPSLFSKSFKKSFGKSPSQM